MGLSQSYAAGLKRIILKESNGNPNAINNWDSNAAAGNPSEGLMQVIPRRSRPTSTRTSRTGRSPTRSRTSPPASAT